MWYVWAYFKLLQTWLQSILYSFDIHNLMEKLKRNSFPFRLYHYANVRMHIGLRSGAY